MTFYMKLDISFKRGEKKRLSAIRMLYFLSETTRPTFDPKI